MANQPAASPHLGSDGSGNIEESSVLWRARWQSDVKAVEVNRVVPAPTWTVLVIAYRSKEFLFDCIAKARACALPAGSSVEVLVADCGGIDGLRPKLKQLADRVLTLTPDIGLNAARNAAMAWAHGQYVALLDDDGEIEPGWLTSAQRHFEDPAVLALRGKIVFKNHRYFTTLASHYDRGPSVIDDTLAVEGNMAIRRDAYYAAGGFGERFYGGEGAQLTYSLLQHFGDCRVIYAPDVVMRHDFYQSWRHFIKKSMVYSDILSKIETQEPDSRAFLEYLHNDWNLKKPRGRMRFDERMAWLSLSVARAALQQLARLRAEKLADRGQISPRR